MSRDRAWGPHIANSTTGCDSRSTTEECRLNTLLTRFCDGDLLRLIDGRRRRSDFGWGGLEWGPRHVVVTVMATTTAAATILPTLSIRCGGLVVRRRHIGRLLVLSISTSIPRGSLHPVRFQGRWPREVKCLDILAGLFCSGDAVHLTLSLAHDALHTIPTANHLDTHSTFHLGKIEDSNSAIG